MRIPDHFNHSVLFLGYRVANDATEIGCKGTGFLLEVSIRRVHTVWLLWISDAI